VERPHIPLDQWDRIESLLPGRRGEHGGLAKDKRFFINAIWSLAKFRNWLRRDLPDRFRKWDAVCDCFIR